MLNYVKRNLPKFGHLMTIKDFIEYCLDGSFIDYDGFGELATTEYITELIVKPSFIDENDKKIKYVYEGFMSEDATEVSDDDIKEFTHIMWYNK